MARFTQSIREIIYENKGDDDPQTLEGLHDIAERALFGEELNVLSDDYVDRFITGFALHFFNDEIGYETLPMWKMALKEKIFNNAEFINLTYENLDKTIFSDYKVHRTTAAGSKSDNISVILDGNVASSDSGSSLNTKGGTTTDAHTGNIDRTRASAGTLERGGSDSVENTSSQNRSTASDQATDKTGTISSNRSGSDNVVNSATDSADSRSANSSTKTGTVGTQRDYDSLTDNTNSTNTTGGDLITEHTGNVRSESGSYTDSMSGESHDTVDDNGINIQFDTPMGSLSSMRTPDTTLRGEGVSAAASVAETGTHTGGGRTYNYMSAASESDASRVSGGTEESSTTRSFDDYAISDSGSRTVDGTGSHVQTTNAGASSVEGSDDTTTTYDTVDAGTGSSTSSSTHNSNNDRIYAAADKRTDDLHDHTVNQGSEAVTAGATGTTTYGSTEASAGSESGTDTFNDTMTHTNNLTEQHDESKAGNVKTDNTTTTEGVTATRDESEATDLNFNYEMFMKAEPMMSKLWTLFDDLFIMIMDTW